MQQEQGAAPAARPVPLTRERKTTPAYRFEPRTGEYLCAANAEESPLEENVYLFPAGTTAVPPPPQVPGKAIVWTGTAWTQVEDHRGQRIWLKATGESGTITEIGPLPEEVTTLAPPSPQHAWRGSGWAVDQEAQAAWLMERRRLALVEVDGRAEAARQRFITPGDGMAAVYEAKRREAISFGAGLGWPDEFPLLVAEAARTGQAPSTIAEIWSRRSASWSRNAAAIETARLDAKHAITTSPNERGIEAAMMSFIAALAALPVD